MMNIKKLLFFAFLFLFNAFVFGEGSKDLNPSPALNVNAKRAYLRDASFVYVFAKTGETIYVGSSAMTGSGQIKVTSPAGVTTTFNPSGAIGLIDTRAKEIAGPVTFTAGGYTPATVNATSTGIWKVQFEANGSGGPSGNALSDAQWSNGNGFIAAWDVTVANGLTPLLGRAYVTVIRGQFPTWNFGTGSWWSNLFVQTRDGYRYTVNTNGMDPAGFEFYVNNKGIRTPAGTNGPPSFLSINSTSNTNFVQSGYDLHNPDNEDNTSNVTHKMFFNNLANDLPTTAPIFLTSATNTWLINTPGSPSVTNVSLEGIEGQNGFGGTPPLNGGFIKFTSNQNATYRIRIDANNNGVYTDAIDTILIGTASAGPNARYWSGKNGLGNIVPNGTSINIEVITFAGEVHFPLFDAEENVNGLLISRVNGAGAPDDKVYWNDTRLRNSSNNLVVANANTSNPLDATADVGVSSTANGHKWKNGNQDIASSGEGFGNRRMMDTWTYVFSPPVIVTTTLITKEADVEILSLNNDVNNICVGTDVTYTFIAKNNGPDDAPLSKISFVTPSNLTNLQVVSATLNSGVATGIGGTFTGNTFNDTLTTFNNGAQITYIIKGTVSSWPTGNNLNTSARILRPADVTDPDANNPDPAPPTDPENECNAAPSGVGCNNIKNNTVTVFATPTISVAAASTAIVCNAASFTMAANAPIHGTGLWTLVSGTATITTPTLATTSVTGVPAGASATLRWTISNGTCASSQSTVTITNVELPTTAAAGSNQTLCNASSFSINANTPTVGIGVWSVISGTATIANVNNASTTVTGVIAGTSATLRWTISNGICTPSTSDITVTNLALPTVANAGVNKQNCNSGSFTMTANTPTVGTGTWGVVNGTATIETPNNATTNVTGVPVGTSATLRWTISNGNCTSSFSDVVLTNFANPSTSVAGANQTQCGNSTFTVAGNIPIIGSGVWSLVSGTATITNPSLNSTTVTGVVAGTTVTLQYTITNGTCNASSSTLTLTNLQPTNTAVAGANQTNCNNGSFTITGNTPNVGTTGVWSVVSGTATIANVNNASTTVSNVPAGTTAVLQWTISNGICTPSTSSISLTNIALPSTANAGTNQTLCNVTNVNLTGNTPSIGTGLWSQVSGPNTATIATPNVANTVVSSLINGTYTFKYTISNVGCTPNESNVTIINLPTVNAGGTKNISCVTTSSVTAAISGQTWSAVPGNPANATINNSGAITGINVVGTYKFILSNGACTDTATIIRVNCAPTATPATNTVNEDESVSGTLVPNATDFDGGILSFETVINASNGTFILNANGTYTYTPNKDFNGKDTIVFRVCDAAGACVNQQLIITVNPVNDPPIAVNDFATATRDVPVSGNVRTNDSDIDNTTLTVQTTPVTNPTNGSVVLNSNGTFIYTPNPGFVGIDSFKYSICDPGPLCTTATAYIDVKPGIIDLSITKTSNPSSVIAGNTITYTLTVRNNGPSTINSAESFIVKDNLPSAFIPTSYTPSVGSYNSSTNTMTGVTLAPNASFTLAIVGTINPSYNNATITNTAIATPPAGTTDPTPANASNTTNVTKRASIVVTKTSSGNTFVPGTNLVYTITATNNGPSDVIGATVSDPLPAGITSASWTVATTGGATTPANIGTGAINQLVNIPNGARLVYTLTLAIPANFANTTLANTVTVNFPADVVNATPGTNTATETDNRNRIYDIAIVKTAPSVVTAGGAITYQVSITNNGPSDLIGAAINDVVPATITNVTWSNLTQGTATTSVPNGTGNNINYTATIPAGSANRIILTINGTVSSAATGNINNTATITPPGAAAIPSNTTVSEVQTITGLQVVKAGPSSSTVIAGETITFSIEVINSGPSNATGATFNDVIPNAIQNVTWRVITKGSATASVANGTGNTINFTTTIPAGNNNGISVLVSGTVASNRLTDIINTATVTPPSGTPSTGQSVTKILNVPTLQIRKSAPAEVPAGTPITFSIVASNIGSSDAFNAVIADTVVSNIAVSSWTATSTGAANIVGASSGTGNIVGVTANIPTGAANTITITINGIVSSATTGRVANQANIRIPGGNPINSNTTSTLVNSTPSIGIVKTAPATASAGEQISYVLRITNNGPSDAYNVLLKDTVPAELINVSVSTQVLGAATIGNASNVGGNSIEGRNINIPFGNGNAVLVTITGTVNPAFAGGTIRNKATAEVPNMPNVVSNETATVINVMPGLQLNKSGNTAVNAGERINYTLTLTNIGPSNANGITITDNVNPAIKNVTWSAIPDGANTNIITGANGTGNSVNITGNISAASNSKIIVTISGIVDSSFSGNITNVANVSGGGSPAISSNTLATNITKAADLQLSKTGPTNIDAGENITYTVTVINVGPSQANNVVITDIVSPEITNVSWSAVALGNASINTGATGTSNNVNVNANISNRTTSNDRIVITINGTVKPNTTLTTIKNIANAVNESGTIDATPATDTINTIVEKRANIRIVKTASPANAVDQTITYTLRITNAGPSVVNNFKVTDTVPASISNVAISTSTVNNASINTATVNGNVVNVDANIGANVNDTVYVTITGILNEVGTFANKAIVTLPTDVSQKNTSTLISTATNSITNQANITIAKTGPPTARVNEKISYRIDVNNSGISDADGVVIIDTVPSALTNVSWSVIKTSGGANTNFITNTATNQNIINITANLQGSINGVGGIAILVTGTLVNDAPSAISNRAESRFNGITESSRVNTAVDNTVDIVVQKTAPTQVASGGAIQYTITAYNNGPANAINANIIDTVAANINNVTYTITTQGAATLASGSNNSGSGNIINVFANLPSGSSNAIIIIVNGTVNAGAIGNVNNTVRALPTGGQIDASPALTTVATNLIQQSNIYINKTATTNIAAGSKITYTIIAGNTGPSDAVGVVLADIVSANISNVSWTSTTTGNATVTAGATGSGNTLSATANIPAGIGNTISFTITGTVNPNFVGTINNTATLTNGSNTVSSPTVATNVVAQPNLKISKAGPTAIAAGERIVYTIDVINNGPSNANGIAISDAVTSNITNVTWTTITNGNAIVLTGATGTGNTIAITGNIAAGASNKISIQVSGTVNSAFTGANFSNFALVSGGGSPQISSDTIVTSVSRIADITIQKLGPTNVVAGQNIRYSIIIRNNGPSDALNTTIADNVPSSIINTNWTATAFGTSTVSSTSGTGNSINLIGSIPFGTNNYIEIVVNGLIDAATSVATIANTATATAGAGITDPSPATATSTATVSRNADVKIVKSGPGNLATNQQITYTLTVTNAGPSNATNINIVDIIPSNITATTFTTSTIGNATINSSNLTGNNLTINANIGASTNDTIYVNIAGTASSAGIITNTATVTLPIGQTDNNLSNNSSSITTDITTQTDLIISKKGPAIVNVNDKITYTIEVANTGLSDALGVLITDVVSSDITNVTWNVERVTGNASSTVFTPIGIQTGNNISINADIEGTINGPGKLLITINGTVANNASSSISNTAQLDYAGIKQSSVVTIVNNSADLTIQKNAPTSVHAGDKIKYTLVIGNNGPANANNITITDIVPSNISNVTYNTTTTGVASVVNPTGTGNNITITGNINAGIANTIIVTIEGTVNAAATATLNNTATVIPDVSQVDPSPASATVSTTVTNAVNFRLNKAAPLTAIAGAPITYTITATNIGPSNANAVSIIDAVPASINNVTWTATSNGNATINTGISGVGNSINVDANLPAGINNNITITISGIVNANFTGTLANTATLNYNGNPAVTSTVNTIVSAVPSLQIVKAGPITAAAGTKINYTIDVTNNGPSNANAISIVDAIPTQLKNVSWVANETGNASVLTGATGVGNALNITGNINAGTGNSIRINISGIIDSAYSGNLNNTATVSGGGSPNISSAPVVTAVNFVADVTITKIAPQNAIAGNTINYTLLVKNSGPSLATNIAIADIVPASITNVSWTATANGTANILSGATGTGNTIAVNGNISTNPTTDFITVNIVGKINPATLVNSISNTATATLPSNYTDPIPTNNNSTVATTITRQADISIVKTGTANRSNNQSISYGLIIVNKGPSAVSGLTINDIVPANITNVAATVQVSGNASAVPTVSGNTVTVNGNIGELVTDSILVTITGTLQNSGTITNTATVTLPINVTDPITGNNTSSVTTDVDDNVGILISKTAPAIVNVKETIRYEIDITNTGLSNATNVAITDIIPAAITNVNWTVVKLAGGVNTNFTLNTPTNSNNVNITANIEGTINGPGALRVIITGTVANNAPASITNTATAVYNGSFTSAVTTVVNNSVDLNIIKTAPTTLAAGMPIVYTVTLTNNGPADALNAKIIDTINAAIENVNWSVATQGAATLANAQPTIGTSSNISIEGNIPTGINNKIVLTISGVVKANFTGVINNTAYGIPAANQTDPTPALAAVQTAVVVSSNIKVTKAGPSTIAAGNPIQYNIVVTNAGPSNATGINFTDAIPSQIENVTFSLATSGSATINGANSGTGNIINREFSIPVGVNNAITITINGTVNASFTGAFTNTAFATHNGITKNSNPVVTTVTNNAAIVINKTGASQIFAGERMTYTIEVGNSGPSNANGIVITDNVTNTLSNVSWVTTTTGNAVITNNATGTGNTISITANINSGLNNKVFVTISGVVNPAFTGTFTNTATATTSFGIPFTSPTVSTTVGVKTGVNIVKVAAPTVIASNQLQYVINVGNTGPSNANNIAIVDNVPTALQNVSWVATTSNGAQVNASNTASGTGNAIALSASIPANVNAFVRVVVTGTVNQNFSGTITNVATAQNGTEPMVTDTARTISSQFADVEVAKVAPSIVLIGNEVRYRFVVSNKGPSGANGSVFTDIVSQNISGLNFVLISTNGGVGNITNTIVGNTVTANIGTFPSGSSAVFEIFGTARTSGIVSNTASIATPANITDPNPSNNNAGAAITNIYPRPQLRITKQINPSTGIYYPGQTVSYSLTVTNTGMVSVVPVLVVDSLPNASKISNVAIIGSPSSGTATYNAATNKINWNIPFMQAGATATITYNLQIADTGAINNTAIVSGPINFALSDTATIRRTAVRLINLKVTKALTAPAVINVKDNISFRIDAENLGPNAATGVIVTDQLLANIDDPSAITVSKGTFTFNTNTKLLTWNIGNLNVNERVNMVIQTRVIAGGFVENTARINGVELESNMADNESSVRSATGALIPITGTEIFIPNIFTPNRDGKNDRFVILGIGRFPGSKLTIYNRWGNVVYQNNNYNNEWDGSNLTESTYFYGFELKLPTGEFKKYSGWIQLMR